MVEIESCPEYRNHHPDEQRIYPPGGFPSVFYSAYNNTWPLNPKYAEGLDLYNLYHHLLNHLKSYGESYGSSIDVIRKHDVG